MFENEKERSTSIKNKHPPQLHLTDMSMGENYSFHFFICMTCLGRRAHSLGVRGIV